MRTSESQSSPNSAKKSIIYGLANKNRYWFRKGFARYLSDWYGVNLYTAYQKLKSGRLRRWEVDGIAACISRFDELYSGDPGNFYNQLTMKSDFIRFMESECGMCETTVRKRFALFDFSNLEIRGWEDVYNEFLGFGGGKNGDE